MKLNLEEGIFIQIAGTIGQYNTLPIEILVKLMENMQSLFQNIAISCLDESQNIDLNQFKVELSDFRAGSAVPKLKFTPRFQQKLVAADFTAQRVVVTKELENLVTASADPRKLNEYLRVRFKDVERRNNIVHLFHAFTNAAGNSPMAIVNMKTDGQVEPIYPIRRMTIGQRDALLVEIKQEEPIMEHEMFYRKVQITRVNGKITGKSKILAEYMVNAATEIAYSFDRIKNGNNSYEFHDRLHCKVERDDDDNYIIKSEMLDTSGKGETEEEAAQNFEQAFDTLYNSFKELNDEALTERQLRIKQLLNLLIKS
jgi:predicted RNase H-like HicB family nuclease